MTTDDHIGALEAALAAMDGVAGPWYEARELLRGVIRVGPDADAAYIAAANPVAIRALLDEVKRLRQEADRAERRAIMFGDIVSSQVIAMRAAVVAAKLEGLDVGMQWIANTLYGPGHLPDLDEARALGGAQALWDKETAEQEAFRAAHPGPAAMTTGDAT